LNETAIAARFFQARINTLCAPLRSGCLQQSTKLIIETRGTPTVKIVGCLGRYQATSGSPDNAHGAERIAINTKTPARRVRNQAHGTLFLLFTRASESRTSFRRACSGSTGACTAA
jgi:hypothetical protein